MADLRPGTGGGTDGGGLRAQVAHYRFRAAGAALLIVGVLTMAVICQVNALKWGNRTFPGFLLNERLAVSTIWQEHWNGHQAGLRYPERITQVNGVPVTTSEEVMALVEAAPVGTPFTYTVLRKGETAQVTVRSQRFTWGDLSVKFGISFLVGICYLAIGITVLVLKFNTRVSWVFFLGCTLLGLISVTSFDLQSTHFGSVKLYLATASFLPATLLHFGLQFPRRVRFFARRPVLLLVPYLISLALYAGMVALYPDPRFLPFWQALMGFIALGACVVVVPMGWEYFRPSDALARQRARMMLLGTAVAFPVPMAVTFAIYMSGSFFGVQVQGPYLTVPLLAFPLSIAYSIVRHNLFDVDVYIKRALGYAIMLAVVGLGYFGIQTATVTLVLDPLFGAAGRNVYPVVFALLVVFLYNPVQSRVQRGVERLFYRARSDYKGAVTSVGEALSALTDVRQIMEQVIGTIRGEMFVDAAGVITMDRDRDACFQMFVKEPFDAMGKVEKDESEGRCDKPLLKLLARERTLLTRYDLDEDPKYLDERAACLEDFGAMSASMVVPLVLHGETRGALVVGDKKSGVFYTREDVELLETLANQSAVAIENARLIRQAKQEEIVRTNLSRYLSPQIVDQVVHRDVELNLGGDRKQVTVLFSDIRNFTSITESRPADQLVQILNSYFTEMAKIIFANNGSLDKYIGDAVVAVFGSLIDVERPVACAVRAAVEMMQRMPRLNEEWLETYGFSMEMGVGVTTGEVFLGNIGSPERMEFTVIGDTVNVASRLSGLAAGGQILLTRPALEQLGDGFVCNPLPKARVKGKAEALEVFEVVY